MPPGPPPKRDEERRRNNKRPIETTKIDVAELAAREIEVPLPSEEWHPVAVEFWLSLQKSGQAMFYEPSDWMVGYILAEEISRELKAKPFVTTDRETGEQYVEWHEAPMPGAKLNSFLKGMTSLMATESERRRLAIEIERRRPHNEDLPEGVTDIMSRRREALEA